MNKYWLKYSILFVAYVLVQGLVINHLEIDELIYPMIYVGAILMLPFDTKLAPMVLISIILGVFVDALSDTFGLHTSASILVAFARPITLNLIKPRDGYDNAVIPSIHDMGKKWFLFHSFILIFIHHLWFFSFELFRFDLIGVILLKTILSAIVTEVLLILFQYIFYKPSRF